MSAQLHSAVLIAAIVAGIIAPPAGTAMPARTAAHACCRAAGAHCAMPAMVCCPARPADSPDSTGPVPTTAAAAASPLAPISAPATLVLPEQFEAGLTRAHAAMASLLKPPRDLLYLQHATFLV